MELWFQCRLSDQQREAEQDWGRGGQPGAAAARRPPWPGFELDEVQRTRIILEEYAEAAIAGCGCPEQT